MSTSKFAALVHNSREAAKQVDKWRERGIPVTSKYYVDVGGDIDDGLPSMGGERLQGEALEFVPGETFVGGKPPLTPGGSHELDEAAEGEWEPYQDISGAWQATAHPSIVGAITTPSYLAMISFIQTQPPAERPEVMLLVEDITQDDLDEHPFEWGEREYVRVIELPGTALPSPAHWAKLAN